MSCYSININMCDPCRQGVESLCTGDIANNIWYQNGKCLLDNLRYEQVEFVLQRNPNAKPDLLRVTDDPTLLQIARESSLVISDIQDNLTPYRVINNPKQTLPFYYVFRGNIDGINEGGNGTAAK